MRHRERARALITLTVLMLGVGLTAFAAPASAAAAKDTGLLTFVRSNQVYTSTTTGGSLRQLTTSAKNYRPHWSPDGKRIAYVHEAPAGVRNIWVMNANGSGKVQVTKVGDTTEPTWSPGGAWLAFGANGGRLQKIRSTAPFGSPVVLPAGANEPYVSGGLAWSPDGKRIAFASDVFPSSPDHYLLVYTIATREVDVLASVGGSCCGEGYLKDPTWTNDSLSVALSSVYYEIDDTPPAGSHLAIIGLTGTPTATYPNVTGDSDPDYSPTGAKVVFSHWSRIYVSDANGAHRKKITQGYNPDWQPVLG
jgi:Tol biopolymer transport system component